ncbi:hypothetical protein EUTSA_v10000506mg, partial [Eutrema salsugineum]
KYGDWLQSILLLTSSSSPQIGICDSAIRVPSYLTPPASLSLVDENPLPSFFCLGLSMETSLASPPDPPDSAVTSPPPVNSISSAPSESPLPDPISVPSDVSIAPSTPREIPFTTAPSYAARFKTSLRNLRKISAPTRHKDGVPVVQAPASILLQAADLWKGHIVAQFHGRIPPPAKIFNDLNPVWGKFRNITIRTVSQTSCLIFIPSLQTRQWVLEVGYWQAANCAFSVYPWSSEGTLQPQELQTAPTWVILKNLPPQLYSLDRISLVASAIGEPLHTEKSRLDPYHFGDTKVKVEISLDSSPPEAVMVKDSQGNLVLIKAEYPRLPPKCCNCEKFGHLISRCPKPIMKKLKDKEVLIGKEPLTVAVTSSKISLADPPKSQEQTSVIQAVNVRNKNTVKRALARKKSRANSPPPVGSKEEIGECSNTSQELSDIAVKEDSPSSGDTELKEEIKNGSNGPLQENRSEEIQVFNVEPPESKWEIVQRRSKHNPAKQLSFQS